MFTPRSGARARSGSLLVAVVVTTMLVAAPLAAQEPSAPFARWVEVSGTCWSESLDLEGGLQADLSASARVVFEYEVRGPHGTVDLGGAEVTARAAAAQTVPYADAVWFGARWVPGFPYTYVQDASTRLDGEERYGMELAALCTGHGEPAIITVTERGGPVPPLHEAGTDEPGPDGAVPAEAVPGVPRFTG